MRTQGEDSHLQTKERGPRRSQPCSQSILGYQPPELSENTFLLFKLPSHGVPHRLIQRYKWDVTAMPQVVMEIYS